MAFLWNSFDGVLPRDKALLRMEIAMLELSIEINQGYIRYDI